ncbi:MAG TPA: GGDEF domain-containing protein [Bradyrhizobium sp.]|nr:GGDEF domain-containing protein [Bradyrhizobium sp.]
MSVQGPILVVSDDKQPALAAALDEGGMFPLIETVWADAPRAIAQTKPVVIIAAAQDAKPGLDALARQVDALTPYLPFVAIDPKHPLPQNAIPFSPAGKDWTRIISRLRASLRVRTLHATVLRRLNDHAAVRPDIPEVNPLRDATVLLIGRAGGYSALSVTLGEQVGVVGALSIEAAAKHLNTRDIDGIVLAEGFSDRVVDAFLTVLGEDPRFRHLPVVTALPGLALTHDLANLENIVGDPSLVAANTLPMVRQHAFAAHLSRTLRSLDAGGLLDPRTGLLTTTAFARDLATAVGQTQSDGGGLSVARFSFDPADERAQMDGARLLGRLLRQMDFGAAQDDGSVIVAFAETDLRTAHMIARRLSSVMRHTSHGRRETRRSEPDVSFAMLQPSDTAQSLLARLYEDRHRAAS